VSSARVVWIALLGLILGFAAGLGYSWGISPLKYVDTSPASLRSDYKERYRALVAAAYQADGSLVRARARLALIDGGDSASALAAQAQRSLAVGDDPRQAQALAALSAALIASPASPAATPTMTPSPTLGARVSPSPIPTASPTTSPTSTPPTVIQVTPFPSVTPTPAPGAPFVLKSSTQVCDPKLGGPLIQVQVTGADGKPVPGIRVDVAWDGGEDFFYTGLKPDVNLGYADFAMTPGVSYTLRLADGGQPVRGLAAIDCKTTDGSSYPGGWLLTFTPP
jgi:hypothetical protein